MADLRLKLNNDKNWNFFKVTLFFLQFIKVYKGKVSLYTVVISKIFIASVIMVAQQNKITEN